MLLVVDGDHAPFDRIAAQLSEHDPEHAATIGEARERCAGDDPAAVVLACDLDDADVGAFVRDVRAGAFGRPGLPIVAVVEGTAGRADDLGIDATVEAPVDASALGAAVERALLRGYEDAVDALFDACRGGTDRVPDADLSTARERADECLRALRGAGNGVPFERLIDGV